MVKAGSWAEIEQVILEPGERADRLPEDTKKTPLVMRVSGFLQSDTEAGGSAEIKTITGRILEGKLLSVNPGYSHSFGKTVPELLKIGTEADDEY